MTTKEILDKIFKKPDQSFGLEEFGTLHPEDILEIFEKKRANTILSVLNVKRIC